MILRLSYGDVDTLRRRIKALEKLLKAPNRRRTPEQAAHAERVRTCAGNQPARVGNDHLTQGIVARTRLTRAGWLDIERDACTIRHDPIHSDRAE